QLSVRRPLSHHPFVVSTVPLERPGDPRHLHSFPTRRSSDLESRIRPTTMAAEDVLHDIGAISMIGSDSQAMGRVGETIIRTWQTDRKSTRLNSSHVKISYAVFCLKKKKQKQTRTWPARPIET